MVERLNGIQEASGSNPLISTKKKGTDTGPFLFGGDKRVKNRFAL